LNVLQEVLAEAVRQAKEIKDFQSGKEVKSCLVTHDKKQKALHQKFIRIDK
jgi:hypothetical protein